MPQTHGYTLHADSFLRALKLMVSTVPENMRESLLIHFQHMADLNLIRKESVSGELEITDKFRLNYIIFELNNNLSTLDFTPKNIPS